MDGEWEIMELLRAFIGALLISAAFSARADTGPNAQSPGQGGTAASPLMSGESSIRVHPFSAACDTTDATNVRFTPITEYLGGKSVRVILRETFEQHEVECMEGVKGNVTVEATAYDVDYKTGTKLWALSTPGWTGGEFRDSDGAFYRVSMPGCCGSSNTDIYFSLLNGKRLFVATAPLLEVQLTKGEFITGYRFVAIQDSDSSLNDDFKADAGAKDALAIVYMGSDEEPAERLVIHGSPDNGCHSGDLELIVDGKTSEKNTVSVARFGSPELPSGATGVFVEGTLDCETDFGTVSFRIPVVNGHFSVAGAKASDHTISFTMGKTAKQ